MDRNVDRRFMVWVVDDSATDAERVRRVLADEHDVEVMHDGSVMLERLASGGGRPDLVVLDWLMPGISGIEVCRYVRSAERQRPPLPILLLTVRHTTAEILQAFQSGANDYVSKPFVDEELRARVHALLDAKRLLERAEQAEADVRAVLAHAPDPVFGIDAQGIISYANEEAGRVLGRPPEELAGHALSDWIPGLGTRNIAVGPGESLLPLPDVELEDRIFSPAIRLLPSDSAASTTIALRDVTERRRAEARRLDFYSIIAHDMRSPIAAVLLRLELAFRGKHGVLSAGLLADLRKIESQLRAQVGMINDFLELARLEGIGYKIDRKPFALGELLSSTLEDFRPLLESNRLHWNPVGLDARALVLGDRARLAQVFTNLISNAIKFTGPAGTITASLVPSEDHVEAAIEDTGGGIPRDELPHVFERFRRAPTQTGAAGGTGLGLMIVREIVEAHGGVVGVESELGVGSRFWLRLPRFRGRVEAAPEVRP